MSQSPLRIAWIGGRGLPARSELGGGIERAIEEVGRRLAARGHDLTVYCRAYCTLDRGPYDGMRRVVLPTIRRKSLDTIVHTALATLHALGRSYDIVQYFAIGPGLFAWAPRLVGTPSVTSVRARDWQRNKWGPVARTVLKVGEWSAVRLSNAVYSVSRPLAEELQRRHCRPVVHIPNGVTPPTPRPARLLEHHGLVPGEYVLFVGRLVPEKGCHDLLRAFAVTPTHKRLVLAGAPSYSEPYVDELRRLADSRVWLAGHVTAPLLEELYSNAYFCVLPSYVEGMSNALLEALSYQRCVLVSDIPENLSVAEGYCPTFRYGDVADLGRALRELLDAPRAVKEMGERAGELVLQRYSWDAVTDALEELYRALLRR